MLKFKNNQEEKEYELAFDILVKTLKEKGFSKKDFQSLVEYLNSDGNDLLEIVRGTKEIENV